MGALEKDFKRIKSFLRRRNMARRCALKKFIKKFSKGGGHTVGGLNRIKKFIKKFLKERRVS